MKQIRISFAVLAIVFAIASAFTTKHSTFTTGYFTFKTNLGDPTIPGDRVDPENYRWETQASCQSGEEVLCGILATVDSETEGGSTSAYRPIITSSEAFYSDLLHTGYTVPIAGDNVFVKDE